MQGFKFALLFKWRKYFVYKIRRLVNEGGFEECGDKEARGVQIVCRGVS